MCLAQSLNQIFLMKAYYPNRGPLGALDNWISSEEELEERENRAEEELGRSSQLGVRPLLCSLCTLFLWNLTHTTVKQESVLALWTQRLLTKARMLELPLTCPRGIRSMFLRQSSLSTLIPESSKGKKRQLWFTNHFVTFFSIGWKFFRGGTTSYIFFII